MKKIVNHENQVTANEVRQSSQEDELPQLKPRNDFWIGSLLAVTLGFNVVNGEMVHHSGGITLDTETKLMWQDNVEAKTLVGNWRVARQYCSNLNLFGYSDWELPDYNTLQALYGKRHGLSNMALDYYWSSRLPDPYYMSYRYPVSFRDNGKSESSNDYFTHYIRCVRDADNFNTFSFSSFLSLLKNSIKTDESIVLSSVDYRSELAFFLVNKADKNYFGTKSELIKQLHLKSNAPFVDIQKRTKEKLNEYLTIPIISSPTLPMPLNLSKNEFETKTEFSQRVANESAKREAEIVKLQNEFRAKVEARNKELENRNANIDIIKKEFLFDSFSEVMGTPILSNPIFDAETNTMFVDVAMSNAEWRKRLGIKIENREDAKSFKEKFNKAQVNLEFGLDNDSFILKNATVDIGWFSKYTANLEQSDFRPEKVAVTIENKKVAFNELQNPNLTDKYQVQALGYGESNTAKGIKYNDDLAPLLKNMKAVKPDPKKWLFAIAVEKYDEADAVIYAKNSANSIITAMQKRLGISERNTYALVDEKATGGAIKGQLERLLENVKEGDSVYFYYSGHGIPSGENGEAFILPKDVIADYVTREPEFMARNVYKKLSDSKAGKVVAFIDSCYSGKTDGISNIKGVAAGVFKTKKVEFDKSKMVVLTAGTNGQFSNAYSEKGHRLFSYFLAKGLASRADLDINSLYQEVSVAVKDESFKMGDNKRQVPQIEGNIEMGL